MSLHCTSVPVVLLLLMFITCSVDGNLFSSNVVHVHTSKFNDHYQTTCTSMIGVCDILFDVVMVNQFVIYIVSNKNELIGVQTGISSHTCTCICVCLCVCVCVLYLDAPILPSFQDNDAWYDANSHFETNLVP